MNQQMAQHIQSQGRGEDSVLVHMTPNEVSGLQALAMAHGGSLTINPETGLPEAGFLKKLLPIIAGIGLNLLVPGAGAAVGSLLGGIGGAAGTGIIVGAGTAAVTGDLKKGLMAGLGAYGGASLAGGIQGAVSGAAAPTAAKAAGTVGTEVAKTAAQETAQTAAQGIVEQGAQAAAKKGLAGFAQGFGNTARGIPLTGGPAATGILAKAAPGLAASGLYGALSGSGGMAAPDGRIDNSYQGQYSAQDRQQILDPDGPVTSRQRRHFAIDMPEIRNIMGQVVQPGSHTVRGTQIMQPVLNPNAKKGQPMYNFVPTEYQGGIAPNPSSYTGYAEGGEVELSDGAFVLDARTVSEIGNGSSNAGMEALRHMGGRPVQGPGDGVSDSVPARIGRDQPARVARDEVIMPAEVVNRIGKGNPQRGADKLYALMDRAHKARKQADRGQDTKLRRGLA
jgi:hypothetical protein